MSGVVRANWHLDHLLQDDGKDPLAVNEQGRIEELGMPIDLSGDTAELRALLMDLLAQEETLYNEGVSCEIKDASDTCCVVCPMRGSLGKLCDVGCQQERVTTTLAVARRAQEQA